MRRHDREQSREFALDVVDTCKYAVLATANEDGTPYCVPLTIVRDGENIYFHCAKEGKKLDNIRARKDVCVTCVSRAETRQSTYSVEYASATLTGKAEVVTDPEERAEALRMICRRHTPDFMAGVEDYIAKYFDRTAVVRIAIESITGKANT